MTTKSESEILTRTGPGTPMGELFRQYWIPAAKSSELAAGGDPVRLMLLGERLIGFRSPGGRVGIMDHRCPHRCASLFFGRNEEAGLRCVYHGWQYDPDGACVDMPNVPPEQDFKHKVSARAYKTFERNGLVWVFMGDQENIPPEPLLECTLLGEDEHRLMFAQRECNYLQALEGDIDTSHFGFLHAGAVTLDQIDEDHPSRFTIADRQPGYHVSDTGWGTMYAAFRDGDPGRTYWRTAQFLFPFWTMPPDGLFDDHIIARAWVPMDDTHTMFIHISWTGNTQGLRTGRDGKPLPGLAVGMEHLPNTTDWFGRWRLAANAGNDYRIDRDAQRTNSYTGITGIHLQDQAVTESMGGIVDHDLEHLAPSDRMITQTRRRLINAAKAWRDTGEIPPACREPEVALRARSGDFQGPAGQGWRDAYDDRMAASVNPTGRLIQRAAAE